MCLAFAAELVSNITDIVQGNSLLYAFLKSNICFDLFTSNLKPVGLVDLHCTSVLDAALAESDSQPQV